VNFLEQCSGIIFRKYFLNRDFNVWMNDKTVLVMEFHIYVVN
jgi:hypothetical protein